MQARHCLSLAAIAALDLRARRPSPEDRAHAENSLSAASRITAVYRVDAWQLQSRQFRLTTTFRGEDYEMRGEGRFSILQGLIYRMARGYREQGARDQHGARARDVCVAAIPTAPRGRAASHDIRATARHRRLDHTQQRPESPAPSR